MAAVQVPGQVAPEENTTMRANELLLWMSARREGSWQQFRAAVEQFHLGGNGDEQAPTVDDDSSDARNRLPLHQDLRLNLERHGHAELFDGAGGSGRQGPPPSLAEPRRGYA